MSEPSAYSASASGKNQSGTASDATSEANDGRCKGIVASGVTKGLRCDRQGQVVVDGYCGYHNNQRPSVPADSDESLPGAEQSEALNVPDGMGPSRQPDRPLPLKTLSLRSRATALAARRVTIAPITEEQSVLAAEQTWSTESREAFAFVQALFPGSGCPNSGQAEETWRRFVLEPFVCAQIVDKPFPFCE